jgi:hypothetical protein
MFSSPLSARAVRAGHKKSRDSQLLFFVGRTARPGHLRRYAVRNDDLGAGEPVTLTEIDTSAWCATLNVLEVGFDDEPEAFSNINTREELHTWENVPPD